MNITLVYQIEARMKVHGMSIMNLEKRSGLKPHAVRNILTGKSKRPSAVTLQAIADTLRCNVKDLLTTPSFMQNQQNNFFPDEMLTKQYDQCLVTHLMEETVKVVHTLLQGKEVTVRQFLLCLHEVYLRSLQKNRNTGISTVNKEYAAWFVNLID